MLAQQKIKFTSLTSQEGLSSNSITAIVKDRYGLMWFGTEDGLNKYDGTAFTVYRHNALDTNSLPSNDVIALHEDRAGNLYVGTNSGSIRVFDRKKNHFRKLESYQNFDSENDVARAIGSDYLGNVWFSNFASLNVLNTKTKKGVKLTVTAPVKGRAAVTPLIQSIFEDSKRRMWLGSEEGLLLYNRSKNSFINFRHSPTDPSSLVSDNVRSIVEDENGTIWIGTTQGLSMLMPDGKTFKNFKRNPADSKTLSNNEIYSMATDGTGKLWIGTEDGLNILDIRSGEIVWHKTNSRDIHTLNGKSVRCVYIDKQGIYWLGLYRGGVNKYDKNLNLFSLKRSNPFDVKGLSAPNVTSFAEDENGDIFVGTDDGGLNLFHRKTELFSHFNLQSKNKPLSNKLSILALKMSRNNRLWIATYSDGLFLLEPRTGKYRQFVQGNTPGHLSNNNIFCLEEDAKGNIWIGTNGTGVNVYNPQSNTFSIYASNTKDGVSLPLNGYIRAIDEDLDGNMWIASHGSGLAMFNPDAKQSKVYTRANGKLPSNVVLSVLADSRKNIWVGTLGGGLSLLNRTTNQFVSFSEKDGLANGVVYKIIEDKAGLLWISTNAGISSFDLKTKKFKNYNRYNGVQNSNFNSGSGLRSSGGELFFGGLDGFNYFYPANIKTKTDISPVLITELKVDNKAIVPGQDSPIEEHISIAREINLDYKQNFSISFVALSYTIPQQYRYSYILEGFDKTWNNVGMTKTASYTNIDPGEYVFKVRATDADGDAVGKITIIKIHVKPPFWLTIYAYIFYVLAIAGILLYMRYRGIQKLRREFRIEQDKLNTKRLLEQERKEAERLHELDMLKIKFLTNLSHEFRTPISLIMGPVDTLLSSNKNDAGRGHLYMIKRNARRLLNLVNQLLDFRKMEEHELRLNLSESDLVSFVGEVLEAFRDLSVRKNIQLIFNSELDTFYTSFDLDKIERIMFNLLSNAFKFTREGGSISVDLKYELNANQPGIILQVSDTGIGIPADKRDKIFERFYQTDTAASILNQGSGIGLSITREFVKMHGGTVTVESEIDKGSVFTILLPFSAIEMPENLITELTDMAQLPQNAEPDSDVEILEAEEDIERTKEERLEIPSVLLVEDNDDFRLYLKENLKVFYKVYEASNGKEGWQKSLALHPQIIVSDISMPFMDGIELCLKVKADKRTSHIPIILLTALTAEEEQIKGLKTGANDYMTKPFNFEILNAKIKNLLVLNSTLKSTYTKQIKVNTPEPVIESNNDKLLHKVAVYIEENLNNSRLSVEDLSKHVGMSRGSLYHKILELTGQSPVEYIRSVKLDKAAILLEKSDLNVAQVAYMVGFATPNYFAKSFKARFNMQPSEFITSRRAKSQPIKV